ncbi:hypothetical protein M2132_001071 [Dysgonomonas sp. PH5-45]|uniref:hypothetical protein n=1 Tax=unclassified Dysgonomonas TaxID=2630389 RepID=UPI0024740D4D|nr:MULTISPECIES: hypothetical protein [unclassified Dysgonomonas]MDH6354742.1 hypothetical protein [Dysgonomonas sp. PH5-45]MDH6387641.1 hypothetical protein [Dysgonomonas sp. PH5-37]
MTTLKFYKGESLNIKFAAYDNKTPAELLDISGYTKTVELFTPYSGKIIPTISDIDKNTFQIDLSADQTRNLNAGAFNIVVKLSKGSEVKIGKSIPCQLLDPYIDCGPEGLSMDNGIAKVEMKIDAGTINFDMFFGSTNITIGGTEADEYIKEAVKDKTDRKEFFNVSQLKDKYNYANKKEARLDTPDYLRASGQVVIYQLSTGDWIAEQFTGNNISDWINDDYWVAFGSSSRVFDGGRADSRYGGARTIDCGNALG